VKVTTGGISVGVGALIVGTLSVAGVLTVRDENNNPAPAHEAECQPQSHEVAVAASEALADDNASSSGRGTAPFTGTVVMPSDQAREMILDGDKKTGAVTERLPEWSDKGYVVVVQYDPAIDGKDPPGCFDETPIVYMNPGSRVTG